ncbi:hypothetical protein [Taibaiella chishuiensis]|uniref:Uncharacterized protein n=1 Tax=Taibaiella chishuiensis TaxID=1434707 RepID=A0A2P8CV23_9BACT|nr:hypothetical protein [Taibaiella chishuiensis]PSK88802.1 hypothetical protein B0I18_11413 [Taibaiella chishuiensis]
MKKILLALSLAVLAATGAKANGLTFMNWTTCTFTFGINGTVGTDIFGANNVFVGLGNTVFADPSALPNMSYSGSAPLSTGTFGFIKGYPLPSGVSFALGVLPGFSTSFNSANVSSYPPCNSGAAYVASWNPGGTGDVIVLIF